MKATLIMSRSVVRMARRTLLSATCIGQRFSWPTLAHVDHTSAVEKSVVGMGLHMSHLATQEYVESALTTMENVLQKSK